MESFSLVMVIVFCVVALLVGAAIGFFTGRRTANDQKQIRELKGELANSRSEHEAYRQQVNNHFQKTSELFGRMTDNYKTVFLHLAEGSQELCSSDAAKLKLVSENFPALEHTQKEKPEKEGTHPSIKSAENMSEQPAEADKSPQEEHNTLESSAPTDESEAVSEEKKESIRPEQQKEEENRVKEERIKEPA